MHALKDNLGVVTGGSDGIGLARSAARTEQIISTVTALGHRVLRYGLAVVIGWIGMMKFTGYEANGIQPLVAHSPLMGWMYRFLTVRQFSDGLGVVEVAIAILIALRSWSPKAAALGSALAVLMFLTTLSFLFSTPGWEPSLGGFPFLSGAVGQFLIKDVVLLGAAIWSLGEALTQA
jgi:reactive chlorine resistance protein C